MSEFDSIRSWLQAIERAVERGDYDGNQEAVDNFEFGIRNLEERITRFAAYISGRPTFRKAALNIGIKPFIEEANRVLQPFLKRWAAEKEMEQSVTEMPKWLLAMLGLMSQSEYQNILKGHSIEFHLVQMVLHDDSVALSSMEQLLEAAWRLGRETTLPPLEALEEDFCEPYVGSNALELHQELGRNYRKDDEAYAAVIPILQSSGVGKTRTVTELSSHAPGLMLCLRPDPTIDSHDQTSENPITTSLPKRDEGVCAFLLDKENGIAPQHSANLPSKVHRQEWFSHCRVAALLSAALQVLVEQMEKEKETVDVQEGATCSPAKAWPLIVERMSHSFFDGIVTGYVVQSTSQPNSPERRQHSAKTSKRKGLIDDIVLRATVILEDYQQDIPRPDGDLTVYRFKVADQLAHSMKPHLTRIAGYRAKNHQYVFIALDEFNSCSHLLAPIRRLMSFVSDYPLRLLLLDTNNKLALVTGSEAHLASLRTTDGSKSLREPYIIISSDIRLVDGDRRLAFDDFLENKMTQTHGDILSFLRLMGRPLWGDRLYDARPDHDIFAGVSLEQVLVKMGCKGRQEEKYIALAASRLPLTIVGLQGTAATAAFLQGQIANHLRSIIGFSYLGDRVDTAVHSEPIMSLAAAFEQRQLNMADCIQYWTDTVEAIRRKHNSACLTIGENGEEFTRLLLTMAMDFQAQDSLAEESSPRMPRSLAMINLRKLLENVFGPLRLAQYAEHDRMINHSWVNFTHFLRLGKQINKENPCTTQDLVYFWTRQVAVLGVINQEAWDILIPVYYADSNGRPSLKDRFEHRNMRFVMVQVKVDPTETPQKAAAKNYKRAMRNDQAPQNAPSLCLFLNLARDLETIYHEHAEMLLVYLSGYNVQRFPLLMQFPTLHTRNTILGLIGRPAAVRRAAKNPPPGSREEWKLRYQTGAAALWTTRNTLTLNSRSKDPGASMAVSGSLMSGEDTKMDEMDQGPDEDMQ